LIFANDYDHKTPANYANCFPPIGTFMGKIPNFAGFWAVITHFCTDMKFAWGVDIYRCNVSPLRGEKNIFGPE